VVDRALALLAGGDGDDDFLMAVSSGAAREVLEGRAGGRTGYWPRVWGARTLLYAWDAVAAPAVVRATADEHWRVREMAAKVIGHRLVGEGTDAVAELRRDPVPRVRAAAERALAALTAAGA
jgi:HEAT repeat protein